MTAQAGWAMGMPALSRDRCRNLCGRASPNANQAKQRFNLDVEFNGIPPLSSGSGSEGEKMLAYKGQLRKTVGG